jgi:5-(aminomethyl)-3-furanmethanol phosphate kinase
VWVVKLGGSLATDPLLPQWLDLLAQLGGGRVTIVAGGAGFADEARRLQRHWRFSDLAAHNMAILAMVQTAYQLHALNPDLQLATRKADIRRVLHSGRAAVWLPFELQRDEPDGSTHWGYTSDSIALDLARKLNAERLVIVKSCAIDRSLGVAELGIAGVVDSRFAALSDGAPFPINLLNKDDLTVMRELLLDEGRHPH